MTRELIEIYRSRARTYDLFSYLYYLIGFRGYRYRKSLVDSLKLREGETVVDLGCGTGLNFSYLVRAVDVAGKIIGVDLTDAMLEKARRRIARRGWNNIELVHDDMFVYEIPENSRAVLSTLVLTLSPRADEIIASVARKLPAGGKLGILDLKIPEWLPAVLNRPLAAIVRPYGITREIFFSRPWEKMERSVRDHFQRVECREIYCGFAYLITAEK